MLHFVHLLMPFVLVVQPLAISICSHENHRKALNGHLGHCQGNLEDTSIACIVFQQDLKLEFLLPGNILL